MDWRTNSFLVIFLTLLPGIAFSQLGYHRVPWGSNTWVGSGRPPHWSPAPAKRVHPPKPGHPIAPGKPVDPGWGVRPPGHIGDYWRIYHRRYYFGRYRGPAVTYQRQPRVETVIIEEQRAAPAAVPARRSRSPLQCGGLTDTRVDPQTGELIIEYVTSSRDCP